MLTLEEPVRLPPTLPPGFGSPDAPCPGQEAPHSRRQWGSWTRRAGEEPADIMFLPRNGKVGLFLGMQQSSRTSTPGTSTPPAPLPCPGLALPRRAPGMEGTLQRGPGLPLAAAHLATHTQQRVAHVCKYPHSPTHTVTHTHLQVFSGLCSHIHTHMATHSSVFICTHVPTGPGAWAPCACTHTWDICSFPYTYPHSQIQAHLPAQPHSVDIHEHTCTNMHTIDVRTCVYTHVIIHTYHYTQNASVFWQHPLLHYSNKTAHALSLLL